LEEIEATPAEFIFILDRSGSMAGTPLKNAKIALCLFLKSLPIGSYFNVASFGDTYHVLSSESLEYSLDNFNKINKKVEKFEANLGGTNLFDPLKEILEMKSIDGF